LTRSNGGWAAVKATRKAKLFQKSDERILGDGDFVEGVLSVSQEHMERKYHLLAQGVDLDRVARRVSDLMKVEQSGICAPGKERNRVKARSLLCYWAVRDLGIFGVRLAIFELGPIPGTPECSFSFYRLENRSVGAISPGRYLAFLAAPIWAPSSF